MLDRTAPDSAASDAVEEWVRDTRAAQGLPPMITDEVAIEQLAALIPTSPAPSRAKRTRVRNG